MRTDAASVVVGAQCSLSGSSTALSGSDILNMLLYAMNALCLPVDPNAVYFVLTDSSVTQYEPNAAFCTDYCGWHSSATLNPGAISIKYSFVGNPKTLCAYSGTTSSGVNVIANHCSGQYVSTPNPFLFGPTGNVVDLVLSVMAVSRVATPCDSAICTKSTRPLPLLACCSMSLSRLSPTRSGLGGGSMAIRINKKTATCVPGRLARLRLPPSTAGRTTWS